MCREFEDEVRQVGRVQIETVLRLLKAQLGQISYPLHAET